MTTLDERASELCAAPAGCAFLLVVEESGLSPAAAAEPTAAAQIAAVAVAEISVWHGAHERVVAMALEHGPRLLDLARAVLTAPAALHWFGPLDRHAQQWATASAMAGAVPMPRAPARIPTRWERYAHKPDWGLWTSTILGSSGATSFLEGVAFGAGDLGLFRDDFAPAIARFRLDVAPAARVFEIDGPLDWHRLCLRYPAAYDEGQIVPDWSAVAAEWDGVHLSLGGLLTSEQVRREAEGGWTMHWGWDAEQTVWLRDVFDAIERLPDLRALPDAPPDWLTWPTALWIKPGPDTWPWLVSISPGGG
ncbi:MAG: hypothetical protein IT338_15350 [Thermomicrobiales bacterium]|nr:hypothetical protein [Thermomicrobiales bacterium]